MTLAYSRPRPPVPSLTVTPVRGGATAHSSQTRTKCETRTVISGRTCESVILSPANFLDRFWGRSRDCGSAVWLPAWLTVIEYEIKIILLPASRPRLERGTYCLGGTPVTSPDGARRGLTCCLAALTAAGCGLTWLWIYGRWLPEISLSTLMFEYQEPRVGHRIANPATDLTPTKRGRSCGRRWLPGGRLAG